MAYSFDFGAQVTRICMDEIRKRGMDERKILRKSATLMQDILWCCQERIVPKKVWRIINYETCTLPSLSKVLTKKGEALLIDILDFLVELMEHKSNNLMDAYHLGEAMGKVTLGPADCDPIIAEKAGHFMTRMIIEHSRWKSQLKRQHQHQHQQMPYYLNQLHHRYSLPIIFIQESYLKPMSKTEATKAKAKSYNRLIQRIKNLNVDWIDFTDVGLRALLDDDFELVPLPKDDPWISIFKPQLESDDQRASPLLYRIMAHATKIDPPTPTDPFASSYWFQRHHLPTLQSNGAPAFSEFIPLLQSAAETLQWQEKQSKTHFKKINHSFSNMKINLRKKQQHQTITPTESGISSENNTIKDDEKINDNDSAIHHHHHHQQQQQQHVVASSITPPPSSHDDDDDRHHHYHHMNNNNKNNKDQDSVFHVPNNNNQGSKQQVKNIMRRVIKIGNSTNGSAIKKNYTHIVY
ncbi:hypothetical protein BJ944DRAFT_163502 [Cunninghamella echinulata]|nr:hypothetical protein BJ944DRAFT_163502 [Cunninghamella echinulata]